MPTGWHAQLLASVAHLKNAILVNFVEDDHNATLSGNNDLNVLKNDLFVIKISSTPVNFDMWFVCDIIGILDITQTKVMVTCHPSYIMISGRQKFNGGFTRQIWYFSAAKFSIFPIFYRKWEFFTSGKIEFCENFKIFSSSTRSNCVWSVWCDFICCWNKRVKLIIFNGPLKKIPTCEGQSD